MARTVRHLAGAPLSIPGGSRSMVVYGDGYLNVTSGGQTSQIPMPLDATVIVRILICNI